MATPKVLYAVRIPVDLKRLMEQAAKSGGVSTASLVVAACWSYLDRKPAPVAVPEPVSEPVGEVLPPVKPDLAALRAICAGNIAPVAVHVEAVSQLPPCPHVEWLEQEGESYACRLSAGHRGKCARGERIA
jgi:hypothetical protein